jgi:hypothetical protein
MDKEVKKVNSGRRTFLVIVISLVIAFLIYYSVMSMMGPAKTIVGLESKYGTQQSEKNPVEKGFTLIRLMSAQ